MNFTQSNHKWPYLLPVHLKIKTYVKIPRLTSKSKKQITWLYRSIRFPLPFYKEEKPIVSVPLSFEPTETQAYNTTPGRTREASPCFVLVCHSKKHMLEALKHESTQFRKTTWCTKDDHCHKPSLISLQFHALFTLFSKFFSSFPHGTCSLSVSRQYLVLDEVHHPIWAAIPSNLTRRKNLYNEIIQISRERDFHPLWCIFPDDLGLWRSREILRQTTIHFPKRNDFHVELFPLRSPLLGESWLVSFPPLNNMLKFSGSSCLIWGRNSKFVVYIPSLTASVRRHSTGV